VLRELTAELKELATEATDALEEAFEEELLEERLDRKELARLLDEALLLLDLLADFVLTLLVLLLVLDLDLAACKGATPVCGAAFVVHICAKATISKMAAIPSKVFLCIMLYLQCVRCLTIYITVWKKTDTCLIP